MWLRFEMFNFQICWCHQATNHYLSQWWPRSESPYGITRPQWVNNHLKDSNYWYPIYKLSKMYTILMCTSIKTGQKTGRKINTCNFILTVFIHLVQCKKYGIDVSCCNKPKMRWSWDLGNSYFDNASIIFEFIPNWAPSQYKDRLIYVWWFPC